MKKKNRNLAIIGFFVIAFSTVAGVFYGNPMRTLTVSIFLPMLLAGVAILLSPVYMVFLHIRDIALKKAPNNIAQLCLWSVFFFFFGVGICSFSFSALTSGAVTSH